MGFLDSVFGGGSKEVNIEEYLDELEMENVDVLHEPADMYIVLLPLKYERDINAILEQLKKKNIVLVNFHGLEERNKAVLKKYFEKIQEYVKKINGDLARIKGTHYAIITPKKIKIAKKVN
ncbi:cell division protein SepF [Candidatus Micrarchaeota archaeon]|nr:cell division protein SepF [Candidatus Micrarchaeota archaeon]